MNRIDVFIAWFSGHRTQFGGLCLSLGAILTLAAQYYPSIHLTASGAIIALVGSHLMTTGMFKSDDFHRDKLKVITTQVDRRNPAQENLIPLDDLEKLKAQDDKLIPPAR